jgi:hypothetical protein
LNELLTIKTKDTADAFFHEFNLVSRSRLSRADRRAEFVDFYISKEQNGRMMLFHRRQQRPDNTLTCTDAGYSPAV